MNKIIKTALVTFVALFANTFAVAQDVQPKQDDFKINLTEQVSIYNFDNTLITQWDTKLDFNLDNNVKVDVTLPVYNDDSSGTSTGIGDVGVDFAACTRLLGDRSREGCAGIVSGFFRLVVDC